MCFIYVLTLMHVIIFLIRLGGFTFGARALEPAPTAPLFAAPAAIGRTNGSATEQMKNELFAFPGKLLNSSKPRLSKTSTATVLQKGWRHCLTLIVFLHCLNAVFQLPKQMKHALKSIMRWTKTHYGVWKEKPVNQKLPIQDRKKSTFQQVSTSDWPLIVCCSSAWHCPAQRCISPPYICTLLCLTAVLPLSASIFYIQ